MYIRELDLDELKTCASFAEEFYREKSIPGTFSYDAFQWNWTRFYEQGVGVIFGLFNEDDELIGGMGGVKVPDIASDLVTMTEMFWYVGKPHRGKTGRWSVRLAVRLWIWGKLRGAKQFRMTRLHTDGEMRDDELHRLYTRVLKLKPFETGYVGAIGD